MFVLFCHLAVCVTLITIGVLKHSQFITSTLIWMVNASVLIIDLHIQINGDDVSNQSQAARDYPGEGENGRRAVCQ